MQARLPPLDAASRFSLSAGKVLGGLLMVVLSLPAAALDCPANTEERGMGGAIPLETVCILKAGPEKGMRHGPYVRYFKSGARRETGEYDKGAKTGVWKYWHSSGTFAGQATYSRARKHGPFKNLNSNGKLLAEGAFFRGKKHGVWRVLKEGTLQTSVFQMGGLISAPEASERCPAGNKIDESQVPERKGSSVMLTVKACVDESGTKDGSTWTFGPAGDLRVEQEFSAGLPNGRYVAWLENGMLKMEGRFRDGKKVGLWRVFNREGTPSVEIPLKEGRKHGTVVRFHDNGLKAEEAEYKKGLPDGIFSQWSDTGVLLGNNIFVEGSGTWTRWHDNGEISEEGELVNGRRDGEWKTFKPDGWVAERSVYANGRRVSRGR